MTDILLRSAEFRSEVTGNTLTGYASTFRTYADLGGYLETFAPTAFDATLSNPESDVRAYYQHDSSMLLGRQSSGTLKVWTDSTGLGFSLELPKTSYASDVRELAARNDLGGMSIGFRPDQETWSTLGNRKLRTHTSVAALIEISPVSIPAYGNGSTTVQLRSLAEIPTAKGDSARSQIIRAKTRVHTGR